WVPRSTQTYRVKFTRSTPRAMAAMPTPWRWSKAPTPYTPVPLVEDVRNEHQKFILGSGRTPDRTRSRPGTGTNHLYRELHRRRHQQSVVFFQWRLPDRGHGYLDHQPRYRSRLRDRVVQLLFK